MTDRQTDRQNYDSRDAARGKKHQKQASAQNAHDERLLRWNFTDLVHKNTYQISVALLVSSNSSIKSRCDTPLEICQSSKQDKLRTFCIVIRSQTSFNQSFDTVYIVNIYYKTFVAMTHITLFFPKIFHI